MKNKISFLSQTYRNIISGYLAIILAVVVNILLVPIILSNLGKELYGLWLLIFNIISYFYLADFGVTNAITRLYAKYKVLGQNSVNKLLSSSYLLVLSIDFIILFILLIFKSNIAEFLGVESKNLEIFGALFLIAIFELFTQFILRVNFGILRGKHKYNIAYNLEALTSTLRILSMIILILSESFNVINFAILYSFSKIFSDSISFFFLRSDFKSLSFAVNYPLLKELIDNSSSTLITSISATLYNALPILLFGKIFGINQVFLYSIPFAIMIMLSRLLNVIHAGFTPRAAELKAINNEKEIKKISGYAVKISLLLGLLSLSFIIFFGNEIFELWLGSTNTLTSQEISIIHNIFILLLIFLTIANLQNANIVIYQAAGLHWYVTLESILSAIILLSASLLLLNKYDVYSFAVGMIFVGVFKYLYYKFAKTSKFKTYTVSFKLIISIMLFMTVVYCTNSFLTNIFLKFIFFFISCFIISGFTYIRVFNDYEKSEIKTQINKIRLK